MLLLGTALSVLVVGLAAASLARLLLGGWAPLRWSEFAVAGLVGSALGGIITEPLLATPHPLDW